MDRTRVYGLTATGAVAVVAAIVVGLGVGASASFGPPDRVVRGVILAAVLGAPGVVGVVGVHRRDRPMLVAAALACFVVSWVSIATLVLAVAGLLYIAAAASAGPSPGRTWVVVPAIVALVGGALGVLLTNTYEHCWLAFEAAGGGLEYRDATPSEIGGPFGGPGGPIGGGCDSGSLTVGGSALAIVMVAAASTLAVVASRPRRTPR